MAKYPFFPKIMPLSRVGPGQILDIAKEWPEKMLLFFP
jgi:hypothetical protein